MQSQHVEIGSSASHVLKSHHFVNSHHNINAVQKAGIKRHENQKSENVVEIMHSNYPN